MHILAKASGAENASRFPLKAVTLADTLIPYGDPRLEPLVNELRWRGADTITLLNYIYQEQWDQPGQPIVDAENTKSLQLREQIRMAQRAGLKVILKASISTSEIVDHWHGQVRMRDVESWRDWFDNYTVYVSAMARLASEEGADGLILGNELKAIAATRTDDASLERYLWELEYYLLEPHPLTGKPYRYERERALEALEMIMEVGLELAPTGDATASQIRHRLAHDLRDPDVVRRFLQDPGDRAAIKAAMVLERRFLAHQWQGLIRAIREIAARDLLLSYAANFDNYENIAFWNALDFIGVNAYFDADPTGQQRFLADPLHLDLFRAGWHEIVAEIEAFRQTTDLQRKPFVFTELGYVNLNFSATQGWNYGQEPLVIWQDGEPEILAAEAADREIDLRERADIFQAIADTNRPAPWLDGVMLWRVNTLPDRNPYTAVEPFSVFVFEPGADPAETSIRNLFSALDSGRKAPEVDDVAIGLEVLFSFLSDEHGVAASAVVNDLLRRRQGFVGAPPATMSRTQLVEWANRQRPPVRAWLSRSGWVLQGLKDAVEFGIRRVVEEQPRQLRVERADVLTESFLSYLEEKCAVDGEARMELREWLFENLILTLLDKQIRTRARWPTLQEDSALSRRAPRDGFADDPDGSRRFGNRRARPETVSPIQHRGTSRRRLKLRPMRETQSWS